jgi:alkylhydroperoxidase family enzyme
MAFVELIEDEEFGAADREVFGYTPNFCRLFVRRPAAYAAWRQLNGSIKETMDLRRYELATVAAAGELRSSYCSLAHGKVLREQFGEPVLEIARDRRSAGLDDATSIADGDHLQRLGPRARTCASNSRSSSLRSTSRVATSSLLIALDRRRRLQRSSSLRTGRVRSFQ